MYYPTSLSGEKDCFQSGVSFHFRAFIYVAALGYTFKVPKDFAQKASDTYLPILDSWGVDVSNSSQALILKL